MSTTAVSVCLLNIKRNSFLLKLLFQISQHAMVDNSDVRMLFVFQPTSIVMVTTIVLIKGMYFLILQASCNNNPYTFYLTVMKQTVLLLPALTTSSCVHVGDLTVHQSVLPRHNCVTEKVIAPMELMKLLLVVSITRSNQNSKLHN